MQFAIENVYKGNKMTFDISISEISLYWNSSL